MPTTARPKLLKDPGYLFIAPIGTAEPTNTVVGGVFTDAWGVAWISLGATEEGSEFTYASEVEAIESAEFFDPIEYSTTSRSGSIAFALQNWTLSNYRRAINGGVAALTADSGSGSTALYKVEPPAPGSEVRAMIGWESYDATVRILLRQTIQGGEIATSFKKAPDKALIPCTFQLEVPATGAKPFAIWGTGPDRGGI